MHDLSAILVACCRDMRARRRAGDSCAVFHHTKHISVKSCCLSDTRVVLPGKTIMGMADRIIFDPTYIRAWREAAGFTIETLAAKAKVSKPNLSKIERGLQGYTQAVLERIADALNCSPSDLLARRPSDPSPLWESYERASPDQRALIERIAEQVLSPGNDHSAAVADRSAKYDPSTASSPDHRPTRAGRPRRRAG